MSENKSEKPIREDKIKRLKEKVLAEIANELKLIKRDMRSYMSNDKAFDFLVKQSFTLLNLREFIESEYAFQSCEAEYEDVVVYTVSSKDLDIWLQDDYSFTHNFLIRAEDCGYDVFSLLNNNYFGYNFTTIFDTILYDKRLEAKCIKD